MRNLIRNITLTIVLATSLVVLPAAPAHANAPATLAASHHRYHHRYRRHHRAAAASTSASTSTSARSESGKASYYSNGAYGGAGHCAHKTLPKGTVVTVYGPRGTASCVVDDRGPYVAGRIIDLSPGDFAAIAGGTGAGVVPVTITW